jgi:hypothetical protein
MFEVFAFPAKAVAQAFDGNTELLKHAMLAKASRWHFHELVNLHGFAAPMRTQGQTKRCGTFAFAITRVDDEQATSRRLRRDTRVINGRLFDVHEFALTMNRVQAWAT